MSRNRPYRNHVAGWRSSTVWVGGALAALALSACGDARPNDTPPPAYSELAPIVEARTPTLPTYPCSRCHKDRTPNATPRVLKEFHTQVDLHHGRASGWCYRCHTPDNIDKLHLTDGTLVGFDESYELCGACHGDKLRNWEEGAHGLTTGYWNGQRYKRSCTSCHNPHRPPFGQMTPERAPERPRPVPERVTPHEGSHEQQPKAH